MARIVFEEQATWAISGIRVPFFGHLRNGRPLRGGQFHKDGGMKIFANEHCSACVREINGTMVVSVCVFQAEVNFRTVNLINSKV